MNNFIIFSILFIIIALISTKYKSRDKKYLFLNTFVIFLYLLFTIIYFSANFFTSNGVDESVIYTLQYGLDNAGFGEYIVLIGASIGATIVTFAVTYLYYRIIKNVREPKSNKIKGIIHNIFLVLAFLTHPLLDNFYTIYKYKTIKQSNDFLKYYKLPEIKIKKKMNIVYIYAESLERTYFNNEIFPNLVENLKEIQKQSIDFTNMSQPAATGWTIGGMVASQCAIPLFSKSGGNSMGGSDQYLSGATCLGDILKDASYNLSYIQGASTKFSGKDKFYNTHKFDEIYGRDELLDTLEDKSYVNGWGLYDDTVFDMAYDNFEKLSKRNEPFELLVMTLDTHHPNGHISKTCKEKNLLYGNGSNEILNAVKCSDYLISKLINKIKNSQYAKNTIVILASDHLAMRNTATNLLNKGTRRDLFLIIDPNNKDYIRIDKKALPFDITPIILDRLEVDVDFGLGRNLFKRDSLAVKFENIDTELYSWRDEVLKFWEFPKFTDKIKIMPKTKYIEIENHKYKLPLLTYIKEDNNMEFYFELDADKKLYLYLSEFKKGDKFLWIDKCRRINYVFNSSFKDDFCMAYGSMGSALNLYKINKNSNYSISKDYSVQKINNYEATVDKLKNLSDSAYDASLSDGIQFYKNGYPKFIKDIYGVSTHENWGRWSDAKLSNTVKLEFKEKLPKKFILEMKIGAYGKNIGKKILITIGSQKRYIRILSHLREVYKVEFENVDSTYIEITPPFPQSPKSADNRELGISFEYLKILKNDSER